MDADTSARPKIRIRGLSVAFGTKHVLRDLDLDVGVGESVVIIGGSGVGKSVALKCILGLVQPDAGSIQIDGEDVVGLRGRALDRVNAKIGMLFQSAALFDSLQVWENVAFGLIQGLGVARAKARETAIEKLADVGLALRPGRRP